jgi:hypothetical protein
MTCLVVWELNARRMRRDRPCLNLSAPRQGGLKSGRPRMLRGLTEAGRPRRLSALPKPAGSYSPAP